MLSNHCCFVTVSLSSGKIRRKILLKFNNILRKSSKILESSSILCSSIAFFAISETVEIANVEGILDRAHLRRSGSIQAWINEPSQRFALSKEELLVREPCLNQAAAKISGAAHYPNDWIGDCRAFTEALVAVCQAKYGVKIRVGTKVTRLTEDATPSF